MRRRNTVSAAGDELRASSSVSVTIVATLYSASVTSPYANRVTGLGFAWPTHYASPPASSIGTRQLNGTRSNPLSCPVIVAGIMNSIDTLLMVYRFGTISAAHVVVVVVAGATAAFSTSST